MRKIQLTQGKFALVDDEDFEYLMQWKWHAQRRPKGYYEVFYACRSIANNGHIYMHRDLMKTQEGMICDHVDHDTLNNQKSNLRNCTHSENLRNRRKGIGTSSIYKGVYFMRGRKKHPWIAQIVITARNTTSLGSFKTEIEAALAYNQAAKKYYGEFACLNSI